MGEQLQESKEWYERRIAQLQEQVAALLAAQRTQAEHQNDKAELLNECEEEMKRMREDHQAEVEELGSAHLRLVREHEEALGGLEKEHGRQLLEERGKVRRLEEEAGALRHQ